MEESTGYKWHCGTCGFVWGYLSDYCPDCGSADTLDGHLIECDCEQCQPYFEQQTQSTK